MHEDDDPNLEQIEPLENIEEENHFVQLTLTSLEWEIINQSLNTPTRYHIIKALREQGYTHEERIIENTMEELAERWEKTW